MKNDRGFTLIEVLVSLFIIGILASVILKSFFVSTKANVKTYEKDKAHVFSVDKIEQIKKDPYEFFAKYKDDSKTFIYENEGDVEMSEEFKRQSEEYEETYGSKYSKENPYEFTPEKLRQLKESLDESDKDLVNKMKILRSFASNKEYYDANWNVVDPSKAEYVVDIELNRNVNLMSISAFEPYTTMKQGERYIVTFMNNYFVVLIPNEDKGYGNYIFWVLQTYNYGEFLRDLKAKYGDITPTPKQIDHFLNDKLLKEDSNPTYDTNKRDSKADSRRFLVFSTEENSIPVRVDLGNEAYKSQYQMDVYNMADKAMDLYILHDGVNESDVKMHVEGGYVNKTEANINKKIDKTYYNINMVVRRKKDNAVIGKYSDEKYVRDEPAVDW